VKTLILNLDLVLKEGLVSYMLLLITKCKDSGLLGSDTVHLDE